MKEILVRFIVSSMKCSGIAMAPESDALREIGRRFKAARTASAMTQAQVAEMARISRPRYRDIETGSAAARATTLINMARALGLEVMLVPQAIVPPVAILLRPYGNDDPPAFISSPDDDGG